MIWSFKSFILYILHDAAGLLRGTTAELLPDICMFAGHALTLCLLSNPRYKASVTRLVWLAVFVLTAAMPFCNALFQWNIPGLFWSMLALALCGITFQLTSKGQYLQNLFLFASYINYFVFSYAVVQAIQVSFMDNATVTGIEFHMIFIAVFCVVVCCDIRPAFWKIAQNVHQGWFSMTMLAAIFSICLLAMMLLTNFFADGTFEMVAMLVALFTIMVSAYAVIFRMIRILNRESLKQRQELEGKFLREQLDTYRSWTARMEKNRHDFRHHNLVILEYAKNGDCDAILQYLQEYEAVEAREQIPRFCANVTVNSIVSAFARQAQEKDISLKADIRIGKTLFVKDTHIVAILANVLENALKGSVQSDGAPWIELFMVYRNRKLIIQCKNSCAEQVHFIGGRPQAVGRTGVGVRSIVETVSEYAGNTEFSAKDGVFSCRMVLNEPEISN